MSRNRVITIVSGIVIVAVLLFFYRAKNNTQGKAATEEIHPFLGDVRLAITTTGIVEPQNRLEIKPSINGRIEEIVVREGDAVKKGDILAWMSSTERTALVDAAGFQGDQARQYWEDVYKKTPLISPINGAVIVRSVEPGQTVTTADPVLVLSDRLIVNAQFDETDIGRVKVGQKAIISLDAYPKNKIKGVVDHIAYESSIVNNVTIYDVDIVPGEVPDFFRSGMSANVEVVEKEQEGVLLIPVEALDEDRNGTFVMVKEKPRGAVQKRPVTIGSRDEKNAQVISGVSASDIVVMQNQSFSLKQNKTGTNPFMPSRPRNR